MYEVQSIFSVNDKCVGVIWKTVDDVYNLCFSEYAADKRCNKIHKQLKRV